MYGGSVVAAAALALAEDVRAIQGRRAQPSPIPSRRRGRRGRGRGRGGRVVAEQCAAGASADDACPGLAATPGCVLPLGRRSTLSICKWSCAGACAHLARCATLLAGSGQNGAAHGLDRFA